LVHSKKEPEYWEWDEESQSYAAKDRSCTVSRIFLDCDNHNLAEVVADVVRLVTANSFAVESFRVFESSEISYHVVLQLSYPGTFEAALNVARCAKTCDPKYLDWVAKRRMFSRRVTGRGEYAPTEVFCGRFSQ